MMRTFIRLFIFMVCLPYSFVQAQNSIPKVANVPTLAFDDLSINAQARDISSDLLTDMYKLDGFVIVLGKTNLVEITQALKVGKALYSNEGYYQCYSLPRYSHQLWFITHSKKLSAPITEIVAVKGKILPIDFCPLISSNSYPMFSNKVYLGLKANQLYERVGEVTQKDNMGNMLYLYKVSDFKRLKLQAHLTNGKVDILKVTLSSLLFSEEK